MMGRVILASGCLRPSAMYRNIREHTNADVSAGLKGLYECSRTVLGKRVDFYRNGLRVVHGSDLSDAEAYESELLRNVHASLYLRSPVGDKRKLWVNATVDPVVVWINGRDIRTIHDKAAVVKENCTDFSRSGDAEFASDVVSGKVAPDCHPSRVTMEFSHGQ